MRAHPGAEPQPYISSARVLLNGLGSDELLGGYGRHRTAFKAGGWQSVISEVRVILCHIPVVKSQFPTAPTGNRSHTYKELGEGRPRHIVLGQGDKTPVPLAVCRQLPRPTTSSSEDGSTVGAGCRGEASSAFGSTQAGTRGGEWEEEASNAVWQPFSANGTWGER